MVEFALQKYQAILQASRPNIPPLLLPEDTRGADAWDYIFQRGYNADIATRWGFGYAPDDFKFISTSLINMGKRQPALDTGIIKESSGSTYDFYRNRIVIPILDIYGKPTGIAGRWVPTGDEEADKAAAKYYNPKDSLLYSKSKTWFGLYQALTAKAFAKQKDGTCPPAFIVEGYLDVISWHEQELYNTVAACGTAITEEHIKIIKRFTNHVVLVGDGDNAGFMAMLKSIDLFLQHDFKVETIELPAGEDPHDYAQGWAPPLPGDENENWQVLKNVTVENFVEEVA